MSYSRWCHSVWYTFYNTSGGKRKNSKKFTICDVKDFTYEELRKGTKKAIEKVKKIRPDYTKKEYDELRGYMLDFLCEVNDEFKDNPKLLWNILERITNL